MNKLRVIYISASFKVVDTGFDLHKDWINIDEAIKDLQKIRETSEIIGEQK